MTRDTRPRLGLLLRMGLSLGCVSVIAITIGLVGAAVAGIAVVFGLTVVFGAVRTYVLLFIDSPSIAYGWELWTSNLGPIVMGTGLVLLPMVYLRPVRNEIRDFHEEVGTTGELAPERHPKISTMARRLAQQAGISEPTVRIVNRRRPESYALGGRSDGTIIITRGLVRNLTDDELEAVVAHEVSHLANGDGKIMSLVLVPMLVAEHVGSDERPTFQLRHGFSIFSYGLRWCAWILLTAVTSVQLVLCQISVTLLSREREFAADRAAARLTGSPSALASALETLHDVRTRPTQDMRDFKRSAGTLDILPPEGQHDIHGLLKTHPETERRIQYLSSMVTGDDP